jgi:predicted amidohydrolase
MRAGVIQTRTGIDPAENASALDRAIRSAAREGAEIVFTPEMSGLLDRDRVRAAAAIVGEDSDPTLARARAAAAETGCWVQLGSLALTGGADGRLVNRGFLIDGSGKIVARYDKMHLFDVELPGGERYRESAAYAPGADAVVAQTPWGALGMSICYDLRFPDLYRALTDGGATFLSVPAAFTVPTGQAHWHVLLRARAIEAGAFVIAAAQSGSHADGRTTYGHSLVVDPWGDVLLDMGEDEGVAVVALDPERAAAVAAQIPVRAHRRPIASVGLAG